MTKRDSPRPTSLYMQTPAISGLHWRLQTGGLLPTIGQASMSNCNTNTNTNTNTNINWWTAPHQASMYNCCTIHHVHCSTTLESTNIYNVSTNISTTEYLDTLNVLDSYNLFVRIFLCVILKYEYVQICVHIVGAVSSISVHD